MQDDCHDISAVHDDPLVQVAVAIEALVRAPVKALVAALALVRERVLAVALGSALL